VLPESYFDSEYSGIGKKIENEKDIQKNMMNRSNNLNWTRELHKHTLAEILKLQDDI